MLISSLEIRNQLAVSGRNPYTWGVFCNIDWLGDSSYMQWVCTVNCTVQRVQHRWWAPPSASLLQSVTATPAVTIINLTTTTLTFSKPSSSFRPESWEGWVLQWYWGVTVRETDGWECRDDGPDSVDVTHYDDEGLATWGRKWDCHQATVSKTDIITSVPLSKHNVAVYQYSPLQTYNFQLLQF